MKMPMIAILVLGIALGAVLSVAADSEPASEPSRLAELDLRIRALEQRIEALEKRTEQPQVVEALKKALEQAQRDAQVVPPTRPGRPAPENWSRREFNGMPYYVIPLQHGSGQTSSGDK